MNRTMCHKRISPLSRFLNRCLYLTALGLSVALVAFPQGNSGLSGIYDMLQTYSCAYSRQERLFVFLNSGFYYPGENIAFKAVLFDADMKIKTDGSRFFYLQLMNSSGDGIGNYTYELHSGECSGTVKIPDTLVTGLYTLRAYTRWMQNYDPANYFRRPVLVISPLGGTMLQTTLCDSLPVKFYPESGSLLAGIENSVLVRVNPCQNDSIRQLHIADDLGKVILSCSLDPGGMAVFSFTPEPGRQYHAIAADSGRPGQTFDLPEPENNGYRMHIETGRDSLSVRIATARETESGESLYLAVMTGNAGKSIALPVAPIHNSISLSIPLAGLPAGINQFVLFGNNNVLCSRVWYRKSEWFEGEGAGLTDTLETRTFITTSCPSNPESGQDNILAVSLNETNAITDSILFNEIRYFRYFDLYSSFSNPEILPLFDASASETAINNCLMASTRCLPMDFALQNTGNPRYAKEVQGVLLSGKVIFPSTKEPVKGATVLLSYPDSVAYMNYSITNEKGEFSFILNDKLYNRKVYIIVQGYPRGKDPVTIIPDDPFMISSPAETVSQFEYPGAAKVISDHQNIAMAFRVFYARQSQASLPALRNYSPYRENFYGKPDFTLIPAEYESLPDIFEIRKNLVPRLKLRVKDDYCVMMVFDEYLQLFFNQEAFVLLNNIPFPSFKNVLELNSDNIRSIELKSRKYFYDNYLMYGIVSIRTRKPVEIEPHYSYCLASVDVMPETFEIPSVKEANEGTLPDVRHSLYWRTERTSMAELSGIRFRTSDITGSYQLKVYVVTRDGKLKVTNKVFTVL
jgi:hypothetical protein